ncbi:MAG TPA: class I SAM-dependent methyltransferase, partial [Longimicrobium sp.]|nr:class I SAM-dependent methyltransferase [Longimicrobium sp.]
RAYTFEVDFRTLTFEASGPREGSQIVQCWRSLVSFEESGIIRVNTGELPGALNSVPLANLGPLDDEAPRPVNDGKKAFITDLTRWNEPLVLGITVVHVDTLREIASGSHKPGSMPLATALTESHVEARWNTIADWWTDRMKDDGDSFRKHLLTPAILDQLGELRGCSVLDAGCGEGYLSRIIKAQGAARVTGVDISGALLDAARRRNTEQIDYEKGSITALRLRSKFDRIICNMVLMDLPDYHAAIIRLASLLKPEGSAVWTIIHPGLARDDTAEWWLDRFLNHSPPERRSIGEGQGMWSRLVHLDPDAPVPTPYFHRSIHEYEQAFRQAFAEVEVYYPDVPPEMEVDLQPQMEGYDTDKPVVMFITRTPLASQETIQIPKLQRVSTVDTE